MRALLLNPRNAGLRAYHGEIIGPARWEPIVAEETWRAAIALLSDPSRRQAPPAPRRLLSGIAVCGVCRGPVCAGTSMPTYHTYRCRSNGHVARRGDHADAYVCAVVVERLARPDAIELISEGTRPDVCALRSEAISLRSRLQSIAVEFADDDTVTPTQFRAITSRLRTRLDAVEAQIADAGRVSVLGAFITAASEDREAAVERVRGVWDAMLEQGTDRCRAVIDSLMTITLHSPGPGARRFDPATIEIVPKEQW